MELDNMVKDILRAWDNRGYNVASTEAAHAIGFMVMEIARPTRLFIDDIKEYLKVNLSNTVFYSTSRILEFIGDAEIVSESEYVRLRNEGIVEYHIYSVPLIEELVNDFEQAYFRA